MAELKLSGGHVVEGNTVSIAGLQSIIKTMRWNDLEIFANELEEMRTRVSTSTCLTSKIIHEWAQS